MKISTHALTEGDVMKILIQDIIYISTHALTEGDRRVRCRGGDGSGISTHALTEGDKSATSSTWNAIISTHALTEGDKVTLEVLPGGKNFNSRPHGGRPRRPAIW